MGYIFIPLGIYLFIQNPQELLFATIFFCGCNATSVLTIDNFSMQIAFYFAIMWILSNWLKFEGKIKKVKLSMPKSLFAFYIVILISLFMPFFVKKGMKIVSIDGGIGYTYGFSSSNITQTIYIIFCGLFFMSVVHAIRSQKCSIDRIINVYCAGIIYVSVISLYQIFAIKFGLPYDELFRQDVHATWWGTRISGPCLEASMLSYYLLTGLPLIVRRKWKTWLKVLSVIFCITIGLYSLSSSFIVGIVLWGEIELFARISKGGIKVTKNNIYLALVLIIVVITAGVCMMPIISTSLSQFSDKLSRRIVSGIERTQFFKISIAAGFSYPLFGIGFGSSRSTDLFSTWFANIGFAGIIAAIAFIVDTLSIHINDYNYLKIPFGMTWIIMAISVPEPYNLFVWLFPSMIWAVKKQN